MLLGLAPVVSPQAGIGLSLGSVMAEAWQLHGLRLSLGDTTDGAYHLRLAAARLALPGGLGEWRDLALDCPALSLAEGGYQCPALTLRVDTPQGRQQLQGALRYRDAQHWSLRLDGLQLAGGRWQLQGAADGDWQLAVQGRGVTPQQLATLAQITTLPSWGWRGRLDVDAVLQGRDLQPSRLQASLALQQGAWSSADGLQAGEGLSARLRLTARRSGRAWQGRLQGDWPAGQLYSDPLFVDLGKQPLHLDTALRWPDDGALQLTGLKLSLGRLLSLAGRATLPPAAPLQGDAELALQVPDLAALYPVLLQPLAYGGALGDLELAGTAALDLDWRGGRAQAVVLRLDGLHLDDRGGRFGLYGLDGVLHWQAAGESAPSRLQWQGGHLFRVNFGASETRLDLAGGRLRLRRPLALPLLEGTLRIPSLTLDGLDTGHPAWRAALQAEDLSLQALSQALHWPVLAGSLSVKIPAVHYADGLLALDGELQAQAFDGTVRVSGLELREPLGPAPLFKAEASLRGLDLEQLTRTFDFGRITGRLDGDVRGLQLVGWQPVAFDAELRTPPDDDSRHRISQRAVENLTALGNNGAVALSGTFLRFFESFSYDRLRLQVKLSGQIAELDGIAHPDGGYYLVKGAGLPRIDVIGRNRQVAWRDLIKRLRGIRLKGAQVR